MTAVKNAVVRVAKSLATTARKAGAAALTAGGGALAAALSDWHLSDAEAGMVVATALAAAAAVFKAANVPQG